MTDSTSSLGNSQAVIDKDGRVTLKNISSGGIDFDSITEALVQAKRSPAVTMESNIKENSSIVAEFQTLNSATKNFGTALDSLRGSTSSFTNDVFDQRSGTVQTYPSDSAAPGHTASSSSDIISIGVEENAAKGSHTIEVLQKATAHQVRGDAISSKFDDISTLVPPIPSAGFTLNGREITIADTDSIYEIAEKLNNANTGDTPTGVSATIVSASDTEHYIVLSSDKTGTDNTINFELEAGNEAASASMLSDLGLTTGNTNATLTLKNETVTPQNAKLDVNGLGVVIERQSNTIDDVLDGISIDIVKAEPGTIIELEIESDLLSVKQGIIDFVDNYNEVRKFVNEQQISKVRETDEDGELVEGAEKEFGELAFDSTFRTFAQDLTQLGAFSNFSLKEGYQSLSQMGIKIDEDGMLIIDSETLDQRLVDDVDEVEKFFSFNMTSSDTNVTYIDNTNATEPNTDGSGNVIPYYLTIEGTDADGKITGASLRTGPGEADFIDGSVEINGNVLTFTDSTGAEGLKIIYNGGPNLSQINDIEITPTRGIADSFYHVQKDYTQTGSGQFDTKVVTLESRNEELEAAITNVDSRVERYEKMIRAKFLKTEQAMALSDSLLKQLEQQFEAMNKS